MNNLKILDKLKSSGAILEEDLAVFPIVHRGDRSFIISKLRKTSNDFSKCYQVTENNTREYYIMEEI